MEQTTTTTTNGPQQEPSGGPLFLDRATAERVRDCAVRLDQALAGMRVGGEDADTRLEIKALLTSVLPRAAGIHQLRQSAMMSPEQFIALRNRIHLAFGAPGDWGYSRPLGAALADLYKIPVTVPRARRIDPHAAETHETFDEMSRTGGGFVQSLAAAWRRADQANFAKLMQVFGHYFDEYAAQAQQRRERNTPHHRGTEGTEVRRTPQGAVDALVADGAEQDRRNSGGGS